MIPMRHVNDGFVGILAAGQLGDDVARLRLLDRAVQRGLETRIAQRHGLEAATSRRGALRLQIEPGLGEQLRRGLGAEPALHGQARRRIVAGGEIVLRAAPAVLHHVPAVTGAGGVVDDQGGRGALARGFLELVGPATVVGHAPAIEQRRIVGVEARIVDQHHDRLAAHVESGVIVPAGFRRIDAIADEDQRAVGQRHVGFRLARDGDSLGTEGQLAARTALGQRKLAGVLVHRGFDHRHGLEIAVAVAGLQAETLELLAQVLHGLVFAGRAGAASAEFVGGQHLQVHGEVLGRDLGAEGVAGLGVDRDHRSLGVERGAVATSRQGQRGGQPEQTAGHAGLRGSDSPGF